jgi:hypothetical protein
MFTNLQENVIKDLATVYQISTPQLLLIVSALGIIIYLIKIKMEEGVYKRINQVLEEYKKDIKKEIIDYGYSRQKQSKYYRKIYGLMFKCYFAGVQINTDINKIDVSGWNTSDLDRCISDLKITNKDKVKLKELWEADCDKKIFKKELCKQAYISFCKNFFKQLANLSKYYYSRKLYFSYEVQIEVNEILKMYSNLYKISAQHQETEEFYDEQLKNIMKKINNLERIMKKELDISE